MAKKPTKRKAAAKPRTKAARPKTARAKAPARKTATRKTATRKTATRARAKAPARKTTSRRTAKKPVKKAVRKAVKKAAPSARVQATPKGVADKDHLIDIIQAGTGSTKKAAGDTLAAVLGTVSASLKKNQKFQLVGFGTFEVSRRRARKGRNPATGESIRIKASKSVRFKAGSKLKAGL